MWAYIQKNWKTNLAAALVFVVSVPQAISALQQWQAGQHVDWKAAVVGLIISAGLAAAKDSGNHSTLEQVEKATALSQK